MLEQLLHEVLHNEQLRRRLQGPEQDIEEALNILARAGVRPPDRDGAAFILPDLPYDALLLLAGTFGHKVRPLIN